MGSNGTVCATVKKSGISASDTGIMSPSTGLPRLPDSKADCRGEFNPKRSFRINNPAQLYLNSGLVYLLTKGKVGLCQDPAGRGKWEAAWMEGRGNPGSYGSHREDGWLREF